MKKIIAMLLVLSMAVSLVACGENNKPTETTIPTMAPTNPTGPADPTVPGDDPSDPTAPQIPEGKALYTVKLVDEAGNPVVGGGIVQLCLNELCNPCMVNDGGSFTWILEPADYKASFIKLPQGYEVANGEENFYFESGSTEMTIVLKAVA